MAPFGRHHTNIDYRASQHRHDPRVKSESYGMITKSECRERWDRSTMLSPAVPRSQTRYAWYALDASGCWSQWMVERGARRPSGSGRPGSGDGTASLGSWLRTHDSEGPSGDGVTTGWSAGDSFGAPCRRSPSTTLPTVADRKDARRPGATPGPEERLKEIAIG